MKKALESIKWLQDVFVTRRKEQGFEVHEIVENNFKIAIKELEEAMKPKTCNECKWNAQVGDVGIFHCWKSRELHYCQANGFIDYCNEFEPKDNA